MCACNWVYRTPGTAAVILLVRQYVLLWADRGGYMVKRYFSRLGSRVVESSDGVRVTQGRRDQLLYECEDGLLELFTQADFDPFSNGNRVTETVFWPETPKWADGRGLTDEQSRQARADIAEALPVLDTNCVFRREADSALIDG